MTYVVAIDPRTPGFLCSFQMEGIIDDATCKTLMRHRFECLRVVLCISALLILLGKGSAVSTE